MVVKLHRYKKNVNQNKKNILVTGSKGFLGTNLINFLNEVRSFNIYEFTKDSSFNDLNSIIKKVDFIFHFAGVISTHNSFEEFQKSNINLTSKLIDIIQDNNLSIPILFTSSIHAKEKLGEYGRTKSESEELLRNYSSNCNSLVYILRLPHVYGEFQKKDRGSFLTDSINNIIENKEVNMKNPNNLINYLYVQDLLTQFNELLNSNDTKGLIYPTVKSVYKKDVGTVINFIYEINRNIYNEKFLPNGNFEKNLIKVFKFHYEALNKK